MEALPALDAFEDEEIRAAGGELDVGRAHDGPAVKVRRDLRVVHLGHARDLLRFEDSADAAEIHLQDRRAASLQQAAEIVFGRKAFAGRRWESRSRARLSPFLPGCRAAPALRTRADRKARAAGQSNGSRRGHLPMRAEQQIRLVAHRFTQLPHEPLAQLERFERELAPVECAVRPRRVELDRREPLLQILRGTLGRQVGILVDVFVLAFARIDVSVGAQPLVHAPAEQLVNRLIRRLADDVPARHLERAQHAHQREIGMLREAAGINAPPHGFDGVRILACDVTREHIFQHLRDQVGMERHAVRFADARDVVVGGQLHENEVPPAEVRRRITDHEGLDVLELHGVATETPVARIPSSTMRRDVQK